MSSKILKTINMTLDPKSIAKAIKEVRQFQDDLKEMCMDLAAKLTAEGAEIAKMQVVALDAVMTSGLESSIRGIYYRNEHCGIISTDVPYAVYVEFGTGMVGDITFHDLSGAPNIEWNYDINGHGEEGWWYPAPWGWWIPTKGKYAGEPMAWTQGMPARPFMYNTLRWLEEAAEREGIRMFRNSAE